MKISETSVGNMMYLLKVIENVDTDILIYGDDAEQMEFLKIDRQHAENDFKKYLEAMQYWK